MTMAMLRRLAETAILDAESNYDGAWSTYWDGTLGHNIVCAKPVIDGKVGGPNDLVISVNRRGYGSIAPEGKWIAAARYREPALARAVLSLLEEVDILKDRLAELEVADGR